MRNYEAVKIKDYKKLALTNDISVGYSRKKFKFILNKLGVECDELLGDLNNIMYSERVINGFNIKVYMSFGCPAIDITSEEVYKILKQ